jgi:hypothetical protein
MKTLVPSSSMFYAQLLSNGRWIYRLQRLEVGDQIHCPLSPSDTGTTAQNRVNSACITYAQRRLTLWKQVVKFQTDQQPGYILAERIQ